MDRLQLTAEQEAEAQRIEQVVSEASRADIRSMARLLASKPDRQLLGPTEFEVRDLCHKIGAKAVETALLERKKGVRRIQHGLSHLPRADQICELSRQVVRQCVGIGAL